MEMRFHANKRRYDDEKLTSQVTKLMH